MRLEAPVVIFCIFGEFCNVLFEIGHSEPQSMLSRSFEAFALLLLAQTFA